MLGDPIEAVFENGVFRLLQPIHLPEHQRVTLVLSATENAASPANKVPVAEEDLDVEVGYQPLPLRECQTVRVRLRYIGELAPLPYLVEDDNAALDDLEQT